MRPVPKPTKAELRHLSRLRARGGVEFTSPQPKRLPKIRQRLIERGYIAVLPGLLPESPQGYRLVERDD